MKYLTKVSLGLVVISILLFFTPWIVLNFERSTNSSLGLGTFLLYHLSKIDLLVLLLAIALFAVSKTDFTIKPKWWQWILLIIFFLFLAQGAFSLIVI